MRFCAFDARQQNFIHYLCEKIEERGVACLYVAAGRCGGVAAWRESVFCQRRSVPEYSHRR